MPLFVNKRGHLDVRDALGWWSFAKEIFDIAFIIFGGGTLFYMPNVDIFSFIFLIWIWSLIKIAADTPLVVAWVISKIAHIKRVRTKKKRRR